MALLDLMAEPIDTAEIGDTGTVWHDHGRKGTTGVIVCIHPSGVVLVEVPCGIEVPIAVAEYWVPARNELLADTWKHFGWADCEAGGPHRTEFPCALSEAAYRLGVEEARRYLSPTASPTTPKHQGEHHHA